MIKNSSICYILINQKLFSFSVDLVEKIQNNKAIYENHQTSLNVTSLTR